jgi:hypothetical protein
VRLRLRGKEVAAHAEAVLDEAEVARVLGEYVRQIPMASRGLGIRMTGGAPDDGDLMRIAKEKVVARVKPG